MDWGNCVQKGGTATLDCIPKIFSNIVNLLLMFVGLTALVIFIISGLKFMNAAGDSKKLESARNSLIWGIIGLALVLLSFLIINIISYVTGVGCIKTFGFGCN